VNAKTNESGLAHLASRLTRDYGHTLVEYSLVGMLAVFGLVVVLTVFERAITGAVGWVGSAL
jgi:hypothetical protein